MAVMEALLKITAKVDGEGAVTSLAKGLGGLKKGAESASGGLVGMLKSAGGLSGALGSLVPLVSGVGLASLAKGAIDAADDMNDLSQKTGVSVERLSQFDQAAKASGTSLDAVSGAMIKLGKGLTSSDTGPAANALKNLGLSATDANGKLKNTDQIVLEVADKFKAMPDGAKKSALAVDLFGKAGADMIPLLNGGRKAVESLGITMTTKFAQGAAGANDKLVILQTKVVELSVKLGTALMPTLNKVTDMVISFADGFSKMPGWMQNTIVVIGGLVIALGPLTQALIGVLTAGKMLMALKLGATIAQWAGAIGPAMGAISAAFSGLLAFLSGTVLPALLAFFSGPVGWTVLAVAAVVAMAIAFRKPLSEFLKWLGSVFVKGWDAVISSLEKPVKAYFRWWRGNWQSAVGFVTGLFSNISKALEAPLGAVAGIIKRTLGAVFRNLENSFNAFVMKYNNLIGNLRKSAFGGILGLLPTIPLLNLPKFAEGGMVTKPTIAMVGEGGQNEFILPESKLKEFADMAAVSNAKAILASLFMRKVTSPEAARPGLKRLEDQLLEVLKSKGEDISKYQSVFSAATLPIGAPSPPPATQPTSGQKTEEPLFYLNNVFNVDPKIEITAGPVFEFNNQRYVTVEQFEYGLKLAVRSVFDSLRSASTRISLGIA